MTDGKRQAQDSLAWATARRQAQRLADERRRRLTWLFLAVALPGVALLLWQVTADMPSPALVVLGVLLLMPAASLKDWRL